MFSLQYRGVTHIPCIYIQIQCCKVYKLNPRLLNWPPRSLLLTSGAAQWSGHPFVHDKQRAVQPRALHGHLYLLDAGVQSSLPGLLSGEDGIALAVGLCGWWTDSRYSRGKAWGGKKWISYWCYNYIEGPSCTYQATKQAIQLHYGNCRLHCF